MDYFVIVYLATLFAVTRVRTTTVSEVCERVKKRKLTHTFLLHLHSLDSINLEAALECNGMHLQTLLCRIGSAHQVYHCVSSRTIKHQKAATVPAFRVQV